MFNIGANWSIQRQNYPNRSSLLLMIELKSGNRSREIVRWGRIIKPHVHWRIRVSEKEGLHMLPWNCGTVAPCKANTAFNPITIAVSSASVHLLLPNSFLSKILDNIYIKNFNRLPLFKHKLDPTMSDALHQLRKHASSSYHILFFPLNQRGKWLLNLDIFWVGFEVRKTWILMSW